MELGSLTELDTTDQRDSISAPPAQGDDVRAKRVALMGRFGDSEINDFRDGRSVVVADQNVARFQFSMNNALLVGVLNGTTNLAEKLQPLRK